MLTIGSSMHELVALAVSTLDGWRDRPDDSETASLALQVAALAPDGPGVGWAARISPLVARRHEIAASTSYALALAGQWAPFVAHAAREGDATLARTLREEVMRLVRQDEKELARSVGRSRQAARVVATLGDPAAEAWLAACGPTPRLAMDLVRLRKLRAAGDPGWEALFDAVEVAVEGAPPDRRELAAEGLVQAGLSRPAARLVIVGEGRPSPELLAALRREDLIRDYEICVNKQRAWGRGFGVDWTGCGILAELAALQHRLGDERGATETAGEARDVAARGEARFASDVSAKGGLPTEVAAWFLAQLVQMEVARGQVAQARADFARCAAFFATPAKGAKRVSARRTTWSAVCSAAAESGWVDEALSLAAQRAPEDRYFVLRDAARFAATPREVARCIERIERPAQKLYALFGAMARHTAG